MEHCPPEPGQFANSKGSKGCTVLVLRLCSFSALPREAQPATTHLQRGANLVSNSGTFFAKCYWSCSLFISEVVQVVTCPTTESVHHTSLYSCILAAPAICHDWQLATFFLHCRWLVFMVWLFSNVRWWSNVTKQEGEYAIVCFASLHHFTYFTIVPASFCTCFGCAAVILGFLEFEIIPHCQVLPGPDGSMSPCEARAHSWFRTSMSSRSVSTSL